MGEANRVIGQFQIGIEMHFTTAPDSVIAVLIAGKIVKMCDHYLAIRITGIGAADQVGASDTKSVVRPWAAIEHKPVKIRVGDVAAELAQRATSGPGILALLRTQKGADTIGWKGHPVACGIRSGC